jgi:6-phosphogluconolactonase
MIDMPSLAIRHSLSRAVGAALTVALAACGGGNLTFDALTINTGGDSAPTAPVTNTGIDTAPTAPATYTIGGTVSGLTGSGLVLQINGGDDLAISANSNFVFATPIANGASYAVTVKSQPRVPAQTCSVTAGSGTAATNVTGVAVACVAPTPRFAYVANFDSNSVSAYTVDPKTGALSAIADSPFAAGTNPSSVTVDPSGKFAFVVNQGDNTVSAYTIHATTGALTLVDGPPVNTGKRPGALTVDPSGKFVFVPNFDDNTVSAYTIHATTGALTTVTGPPSDTGTNPWSVTVDPSGKFAYVANFLGNNVSAYTIDATTGALSPIANSPLAAATLSLSRGNKGRPLQFYAIGSCRKIASVSSAAPRGRPSSCEKSA